MCICVHFVIVLNLRRIRAKKKKKTEQKFNNNFVFPLSAPYDCRLRFYYFTVDAFIPHSIPFNIIHIKQNVFVIYSFFSF